jgi:hypothetical protein
MDINAGSLVISVGAIFGAKSHQRVAADLNDNADYKL